MTELFANAILAPAPAEVEAIRRAVRRLSLLAAGVTVAAAAAVAAVVLATGVAW